MGTPDFAVPVLEALIDKHNVVAVVSQPDRVEVKSYSLHQLRLLLRLTIFLFISLTE